MIKVPRPHSCSVWDIGSLNFLAFQTVRIDDIYLKAPRRLQKWWRFHPELNQISNSYKPSWLVSRSLIKPTLLSPLLRLRNHLLPGRTELRKDHTLTELSYSYLCFMHPLHQKGFQERASDLVSQFQSHSQCLHQGRSHSRGSINICWTNKKWHHWLQ